MPNFIEVVVIRDSKVMDGIIHGAYHRNRSISDGSSVSEDFKELSEIKDAIEDSQKDLIENFFAYVDVTKKAAQASLYSILRKEDSLFWTMGFKDHVRELRGRTISSPSFFFSDNLEVFEDNTLSKHLFHTLQTLFLCGKSRSGNIRFYVSSQISDRFIEALRSALYKYLNDTTRSYIHPNGGVPADGDSSGVSIPLPENISPQEFFKNFVEQRYPDSSIEKLKYIVLGNDHAWKYSDTIINRVGTWCAERQIQFYIPPGRFADYIERQWLGISGTVA